MKVADPKSAADLPIDTALVVLRRSEPEPLAGFQGFGFEVPKLVD